MSHQEVDAPGRELFHRRRSGHKLDGKGGLRVTLYGLNRLVHAEHALRVSGATRLQEIPSHGLELFVFKPCVGESGGRQAKRKPVGCCENRFGSHERKDNARNFHLQAHRHSRVKRDAFNCPANTSAETNLATTQAINIL